MSNKLYAVAVAVLVAIILLCGVKFVKAQELTTKQLMAKAAVSQVGDVLSRAGAVEIKKAPVAGQVTAKIYASPQWTANGAPLIVKDEVSGRVTSRGRYVNYIPDEATAKLEVSRTVGNASVKELWTVPDAKTTQLVWTVETDAPNTEFTDGELIFRDTLGEIILKSPPPVAWDADKKPVEIKVIFELGKLSYALPEGELKYPVTVDPTSVMATNNGYIESSGTTYSTVRDATSAGHAGDHLYVGQDGGYYDVYRSFFTFAIPNMTTLTSASLYLFGRSDLSQTDFDLYFLTSTYSDPLVNNDFIKFNGHQSSGTYNGTLLTNTWNSVSYSSSWNEFTFNSAGKDSIYAKKGSNIKMTAISSNDYNNITPSDYESLAFSSAVTSGEEPYLSLTFSLSSGSPTNTQSRLFSPGNPSYLWNHAPKYLWKP